MRHKLRINAPNKKDILQYVPIKYACIYEIKCLINNRIYIGQSHDLTGRWNQHIAGNLAPQNFAHLTSKKLIEDVQRFGIENFTFRIIKKCFALTKEEREALEQHYIDELNPYYNIRK